jgi:hypothetical protein
MKPLTLGFSGGARRRPLQALLGGFLQFLQISFDSATRRQIKTDSVPLYKHVVEVT